MKFLIFVKHLYNTKPKNCPGHEEEALLTARAAQAEADKKVSPLSLGSRSRRISEELELPSPETAWFKHVFLASFYHGETTMSWETEMPENEHFFIFKSSLPTSKPNNQSDQSVWESVGRVGDCQSYLTAVQ